MLWPWLILCLVGVLGLGIGLWVGSRREAPLNGAPPASRPTIVIAAPSAVVVVSPVPSPAAVVARASPSPEREYVVQAGDTLRTIAEQQYGDATLWQRLYQANTDVIGNNPDALQPGMRLRIPPA